MSNVVQGFFTADDMFVVVALPQFTGERIPIMATNTVDVMMGGNRFERLNNTTHRIVQCSVGAILVIARLLIARCGANTRFAPTVQNDDSMYVIGHCYKCVQFNVGVTVWQIVPRGTNHLPGGV